MPSLSWMEMLVVGIVALIVIGPKDLPGVFRQVGQFVGKAKGMAREFSSAMNAAADESGVREINKTIKAATNPQKFGVDKIREATKMDSFLGDDDKPESETDKLRGKMTEERKETAKKMSDAMAKAATDRVAAEKTADKARKLAEAEKIVAEAKAEKAAAAKAAKAAAAKAKRDAAKAAKDAT
ncbi:MAG: Sec-independent protein translocase protein TatB [Octadecabacter sp.]|nr:Sec-independent protein translocase protein TatB [Octadecabacter sp.]